MDVKLKILENVRKQATIQARIGELQKEGERLTSDLNKLGGQMELLGEIFHEENGVDINTFLNQDEDFRKKVQEASASGQKINAGTAPPAAPQAAPSTVRRAGNKTLRPVEDVAAPEPEDVPESTGDEPTVEVTRTRNPPKIVVTDDPVVPDKDDD